MVMNHLHENYPEDMRCLHKEYDITGIQDKTERQKAEDWKWLGAQYQLLQTTPHHDLHVYLSTGPGVGQCNMQENPELSKNKTYGTLFNDVPMSEMTGRMSKIRRRWIPKVNRPQESAVNTLEEQKEVTGTTIYSYPNNPLDGLDGAKGEIDTMVPDVVPADEHGGGHNGDPEVAVTKVSFRQATANSSLEFGEHLIVIRIRYSHLIASIIVLGVLIAVYSSCIY